MVSRVPPEKRLGEDQHLAFPLSAFRNPLFFPRFPLPAIGPRQAVPCPLSPAMSLRSLRPWFVRAGVGVAPALLCARIPMRPLRLCGSKRVDEGIGVRLAMMSLDDSLAAVLLSPTAADVWSLRADLLERDVPDDSRMWALLGEFHHFLDRLATVTTAREYSNFASKLDIGAISGVIFEHLSEEAKPSERAMRLLSGALSEGLMALGTRQHVRVWEGELAAVHRDAAWFLYGELWRWTRDRTPELDPAERRRLLDELMDPFQSPETTGEHKAILIGRLFQVLVRDYVSTLTV